MAGESLAGVSVADAREWGGKSASTCRCGVEAGVSAVIGCVAGRVWNECYVDGRWITVDATPGNSNKWNRNTNKWTYTGLTNYIYFDPTPEQLATSHVLLEIKGA